MSLFLSACMAFAGSWEVAADVMPSARYPKTYQEIFAARKAAANAGHVFAREPFSIPDSRWRGGGPWPSYADWSSVLEAEMTLSRALPAEASGDVLLGDSLLFWYPPELKPAGRELLPLALAGESSAGLVARLGVLEGVGFQRAFVLIGINDFLAERERQGGRLTAEAARPVSAAVIERVQRTVARLGELNPRAEIFVLSLLPTRGDLVPNGAILAHNAELAVGVSPAHFLDVHRHLVGRGPWPANIQLDPALTTDGLHLNFEGYRRLAAALSSEIPTENP